MTCLLGQSGLWEFQAITPRRGAEACGSRQKQVEDSGSKCKTRKGLEGVRKGQERCGSVQKRSGRLWESAEETGRHGMFSCASNVSITA